MASRIVSNSVAVDFVQMTLGQAPEFDHVAQYLKVDEKMRRRPITGEVDDFFGRYIVSIIILTAQRLSSGLHRVTSKRLRAKEHCKMVSMLNVSRHERMTQKYSAPANVRKQPEIFFLTLGIRTARSPTLVKDTAGSLMKRKTASAWRRKRSSRLTATDCLPRPRWPGE